MGFCGHSWVNLFAEQSGKRIQTRTSIRSTWRLQPVYRNRKCMVKWPRLHIQAIPVCLCVWRPSLVSLDPITSYVYELCCQKPFQSNLIIENGGSLVANLVLSRYHLVIWLITTCIVVSSLLIEVTWCLKIADFAAVSGWVLFFFVWYHPSAFFWFCGGTYFTSLSRDLSARVDEYHIQKVRWSSCPYWAWSFKKWNLQVLSSQAEPWLYP